MAFSYDFVTLNATEMFLHKVFVTPSIYKASISAVTQGWLSPAQDACGMLVRDPATFKGSLLADRTTSCQSTRGFHCTEKWK